MSYNNKNQRDIENQAIENFSFDERNIESDKFILWIAFFICLIITLPVLICDIYFVTSNSECITTEAKELSINMKVYLIGCVCESLLIFTAFAFLIKKYSSESLEFFEKYYILFFISYIILSIFMVAWHILGAVIFFGTLYPEHKCSKNANTYLFVSLIMKLLGCLICVHNKRKNNK